jgi:hypothetical protein
MAEISAAAERFAELARALREAGETGLRKELYKALSDATKPLAAEIRSEANLKPRMPDRYAEILAADLSMRVLKNAGKNPSVSLRVKGRVRGRHVTRLNRGILTHPVFGTEAQEALAMRHGAGWAWVSQDIAPGFFDSPVERAGPQVREEVARAVRRVIDHIYRFTR